MKTSANLLVNILFSKQNSVFEENLSNIDNIALLKQYLQDFDTKTDEAKYLTDDERERRKGRISQRLEELFNGHRLIKAPPISVDVPIAVVLFAGGGGIEAGMIEAGIKPVIAVELDPKNKKLSDKIIEVHNHNFEKFGCQVVRKTVEQVAKEGFIDFPSKPDYLHSSNVCKNFSQANGKKKADKEQPEDIKAAQAVALAIEKLQPKNFTLEQVRGFQDSESFRIIVEALTECGYTYYWDIVNFAEYSLPQARHRLILRAGKQAVLPLPPIVKNRVSWYEAISHLIPKMEDSTLLTSQKKATAQWEEEHPKKQPLLVQRVGVRESCKVRPANLPALTILASHFKDGKGCSRNKFADIVLIGGITKSLSLEAVKILQGFPDWYEFPEDTTTATAGTILGNAVPPLFAKQLFSGIPVPVHGIKPGQVWARGENSNPCVVVESGENEVKVVWDSAVRGVHSRNIGEMSMLQNRSIPGDLKEGDHLLFWKGDHIGERAILLPGGIAQLEDGSTTTEIENASVVHRPPLETAVIVFSEEPRKYFEEYCKNNGWGLAYTVNSKLQDLEEGEKQTFWQEIISTLQEDYPAPRKLVILGDNTFLEDLSELSEDYEIILSGWTPSATKVVEGTTYLRIDKIDWDTDTQSRICVDPEAVADYKRSRQDKVKFPPITVYHDHGKYYIADGWHRTIVEKELDNEWISAEIVEGDKRDAVLHSCGANSNHGLRRSSADKRKAINTLLADEEWRKWSNREIARKCGVDEKTVRKCRESFRSSADYPQMEVKAVRNGKEFTVTTKNIGKKEVFPRQALNLEGSVITVTHKDEDGNYITDTGEILKGITEIPKTDKPITTVKQEEKAIAQSLGLKTGDELIPKAVKNDFVDEEQFGRVASNQARINELKSTTRYITSAQSEELIDLIDLNKLDAKKLEEIQRKISKVLTGRSVSVA